jgi:hypothetical protein
MLTALLFVISLLSLSAITTYAYGPRTLGDFMLPIIAASVFMAYFTGRRLSAILGLEEDVINSMVLIMMMAMIARPTLPLAAHGLTAVDLNVPTSVFPNTFRTLIESVFLVPVLVWLPHALAMYLEVPPKVRRFDMSVERGVERVDLVPFESKNVDPHVGLELIDVHTLALTPYMGDR